MTDEQGILLYFCYGAQEIYNQAIYSILSLLHVDGGAPRGYRIVAYCDRPGAFAGLPVEIVLVDAGTLEHWLGGSDYIHRRKSCVIIDALNRFGGRIMFVDTDTWFRQPPAAMFARVGPKRACFHIREGALTTTGTPSDQALLRQLATTPITLDDGETITVSRSTPMWNTGVVGVDATDLELVCKAVSLSDAIWAVADPQGAYGRKIHHAEQFAMGWAFRECTLRETDDFVFHYWPAPMKNAFDLALPKLVALGLSDRTNANLARIYAARPRQTGFDALRDAGKMALRKAAIRLGNPLPGVRRSVG